MNAIVALRVERTQDHRRNSIFGQKKLSGNDSTTFDTVGNFGQSRKCTAKAPKLAVMQESTLLVVPLLQLD